MTAKSLACAPATPDLSADLALLVQGRHPDPFAFLGRHAGGSGVQLRVFWPRTRALRVAGGPVLARVGDSDLFVWSGPTTEVPATYELLRIGDDNREERVHDPYAFPPLIGDFDRQVFAEGHHWHAYQFLGANPRKAQGVAGVLFATWAPSAERVSVVGDFNDWDGRRLPMHKHPGGIWELFVPDLPTGALYKFEIRGYGGGLALKSDPYGKAFQAPPETASVVVGDSAHAWADSAWLERRKARDWLHTRMSAYEVHLGSWKRAPDGSYRNYREIAAELAPYVKEMGFSHIELMPVSEHPYDPSWGYQTTGNYAPTRRFGTPDDFRWFVDHCHAHGLGVILDWVPAHFPRDAHGLARFDGNALYEHGDPRQGEHPDWDTLIYDYGRPEVRNYLLASALNWLEEFHVDGLRVDAVASMLYLDYSRRAGEWVANRYGGRENLDAIAFLRELNSVVHEHHPGALVIAEESTTWPLVARPTSLGGLGFSMKWNMGWMHDTLAYFKLDPVFRAFHHQKLTFSQLYAYSENFVLAFSHDEVVHGKGSLLRKMAGDEWQRFAHLRLLYTYLWTHPGKKLLFMGQEFAQDREWNHDASLDWELLERPRHQGVRRLVADLNRLYALQPALHSLDFEVQGFSWIDCHDSAQSVLSFIRRAGPAVAVVVLNFTPIPRFKYRIGVPLAGEWREAFNSDSTYYGGANVGNAGVARTEPRPWMEHPQSLELSLPPLGGIVLLPVA